MVFRQSVTSLNIVEQCCEDTERWTHNIYCDQFPLTMSANANKFIQWNVKPFCRHWEINFYVEVDTTLTTIRNKNAQRNIFRSLWWFCFLLKSLREISLKSRYNKKYFHFICDAAEPKKWERESVLATSIYIEKRRRHKGNCLHKNKSKVYVIW